MNRATIPLLLLSLAAVVATPFGARAGQLLSGERIRVHTRYQGHSAHVVGTVVSMDDDTLVVQTNGESDDQRRHEASPHQTTTIPLSAVTGVDRWAGTENHTFAGALIGTAGGLVVGYMTRESSQQTEGSVTVDAAPLQILLCGIIGAGLGALVGHLVETDQWDRVDGFPVAVTPTTTAAGALAVSLNFAF